MTVPALVAGCGDQSLSPPPVPTDSEAYWELVLDHHAALMSLTPPYNTLQISAVPRNFRHEPLAGLPAPQFRSLTPAKLIATPDGSVVVGDTTAVPGLVEASLTINNLKHADTIMIVVVDIPQPPVLNSLSIHPIAPDSAKIGVSSAGFTLDRVLPIRAMDANGSPFPVYGHDNPGILPIRAISSDPSILRVLQPPEVPVGATIVRGMSIGTTTVIASTVAFGVPKADTLTYRVGFPLFFLSWIQRDVAHNFPSGLWNLTHPEVRISTGAAVAWWLQNSEPDGSDTVHIKFTEADLPNVAAPRPIMDVMTAMSPFLPIYLCSTSECDNGGNFSIPGGPYFATVGRRFLAPGIYAYTMQPGGIAGRVVVVDESATP